MKLSFTTFLAALFCMLGVRRASASAIITFADNDTFEGDVPTSTAGPFTDPVTTVVGTITTNAIAPASSVLNPNAGTLGVNAPGADTAGAFDNGESWTMSWNKLSQFVGINFGSYGTAENNAFSVQSPAWVGLSITPGSASVSFTSATGTFIFGSGTNADSDIFTSTDLYGVGTVPTIGTGTNITFAYSVAGQNATIEDFTFNLVPEPASFAVMMIGGFLALRRRKLLV